MLRRRPVSVCPWFWWGRKKQNGRPEGQPAPRVWLLVKLAGGGMGSQRYLSNFFDLGLALCVLYAGGALLEPVPAKDPRRVCGCPSCTGKGALPVGFVTVYCGAGCGPLEGRLAGVSHTLEKPKGYRVV